jgi:hypothetical protein
MAMGRAFPKSSDEPLLCHPERSDTCVCDVGADEDLDTRTKRFFTSFRMTHVYFTADYGKALWRWARWFSFSTMLWYSRHLAKALSARTRVFICGPEIQVGAGRRQAVT